MPFVHIRSLPLGDDVDVTGLLQAVTRDLSRAVGVSPEHVTATWRPIEPGHYVVAGRPAGEAGAAHPILVEMLAPDANPPERLEAMVEAVARSVAAAAGVPLERVFASVTLARSGLVFDGGALARW